MHSDRLDLKLEVAVAKEIDLRSGLVQEGMTVADYLRSNGEGSLEATWPGVKSKVG